MMDINQVNHHSLVITKESFLGYLFLGAGHYSDEPRGHVELPVSCAHIPVHGPSRRSPAYAQLSHAQHVPSAPPTRAPAVPRLSSASGLRRIPDSPQCPLRLQPTLWPTPSAPESRQPRAGASQRPPFPHPLGAPRCAFPPCLSHSGDASGVALPFGGDEREPAGVAPREVQAAQKSAVTTAEDALAPQRADHFGAGAVFRLPTAFPVSCNNYTGQQNLIFSL
mgnify:FL=1